MLAPSIVVALAASLVSDPPAPPLQDLLARAAAYVEQYKHEFALVVSDEQYVQRISGPATADAPARRRRTTAEMLFMWMEAEQSWLTVRNVLTVDRGPVPDSQERLNTLLSESAADPVARLERLRRVRDESARFNLGTIVRNMNYPTLPLQFLESRHQPRFLFVLVGPAVVAGERAWQVRFLERRAPTFIQGEAGEMRPASGAVWLRAADGAVLRTELRLNVAETRTSALVAVDYALDAKLRMWVPKRMEEHYSGGVARRDVERIDCVATYANVRRFETSGRILP